MRGRPTSDPKQVSIKARISEEMKLHLEKSAAERGMNVSEYLRQMIEGDMRCGK